MKLYQALAIYVSELKNPRLAEEYCVRTYDKDKENAKDVYLSLLKVDLHLYSVVAELF